MAEVITRTDLENARRDADDFAKVVNSAANAPDIVTRQGLAITPLAKKVAAIPDFGSGINTYGPFVNNAAFVIPAGVKTIRTSGYYVDGDGGGAIMVEVPVQPAYPTKFQTSDGRWWGLSANQTFWAKTFGAKGDGVTNDAPAINAGLNASVVSELWLGDGIFGILAGIILPSGKALRGLGPERSTIQHLTGYTDPTNERRSVTCLPASVGCRWSGFTIDGQMVGFGLGSANRVHGMVPRGKNFVVQQVYVKNITGYTHWAFGGSMAQLANGVFYDCYGENADVYFEQMYADGVTYINCHARSGAGTNGNEAFFHPWNGATNVRFIGCTAKGNAGAGLNAIADVVETRVALISCDIVIEGSKTGQCLIGGGPFKCDITVTGGSYQSTSNHGVNFTDATIRVTGAKIRGYAAAMAVARSEVHLSNCQLYAETPVPSGIITFGIIAAEASVVRMSAGRINIVTASGLAVPYSNYDGTADIVISRETVIFPVPVGGPVLFRPKLQETGGTCLIKYSAGSGLTSQYLIDLVFPANITDRTKVAVTGMLVHAAASTYTYVGTFSVVATHAVSLATNTYRLFMTGIDLGAKDASNFITNFRWNWHGVEFS